MKNLLFFATFCLILVGCAPKNEEAFTNSRSISSVTNSYSRWPSSAFPLELSISSDFSMDEADAIANMAAQWSQATDNKKEFFTTTQSTQEKGTENLNQYNDKTMGIYKITNWPKDLPKSALAITQIFGHKVNVGTANEYIKIDHADILVNFDTFEFSTDYGYGYDFQTVVLHEMGHFLGLYHDNSSAEESVMYPSISRFRDNRQPKYRDIDNITSLYSVQNTMQSKTTFTQNNFMSNLNMDANSEQPVVIIYEMYPNGKEKSYISYIK